MKEEVIIKYSVLVVHRFAASIVHCVVSDITSSMQHSSLRLLVFQRALVTEVKGNPTGFSSALVSAWHSR